MAKEKNATRVLSKLESFYMVKSLANRLYMKQKLSHTNTRYAKAVKFILHHGEWIILSYSSVDVSLSCINPRKI